MGIDLCIFVGKSVLLAKLCKWVDLVTFATFPFGIEFSKLVLMQMINSNQFVGEKYGITPTLARRRGNRCNCAG